jgi:hypothetical protein
MFLVHTRKAWTTMAMVTVGAVIATLVGYQFESASHVRSLACPSEHHQSHLPHATAALDCLVAILPTAIALAPWYLCMLYATDHFVCLQAFAFPLVLPP